MSLTKAQSAYRGERFKDAIAVRDARIARQRVRDAAPDMLQALLLIDIESLPDDVQWYVRAAIAKAEV